MEEAREKIRSQIPEGFHLLSEQVISDGKPKTVQSVGDTIEVAFADVQRNQIPNNADTLEKKEVASEQRLVRVAVEAFDKQSAKSSAEGKEKQQSSNPLKLQSVKLIAVGRKEFWGLEGDRINMKSS